MATKAFVRTTGKLRLLTDDRRETVNQLLDRGSLREAIADSLNSEQVVAMWPEGLETFRTSASLNFANGAAAVHRPPDEGATASAFLGNMNGGTGTETDSE